jgi:toxin-antitoxin system PIN domain toxin
MLITDVNVLVYAFRRESKRHEEYRQWLERALTGDEVMGVSELVLSGFLRIVTNHRIYVEPTTPEAALAFCDAVLAAPAALAVRPTAEHWAVLRELCTTARTYGNHVPDAYHAALAIEHGATWITNDRGFGRFPGLRWKVPLDQGLRNTSD